MNPDADRTNVLNQIKNIIQSNSNLGVYSLETEVNNNLNFLSSIWSVIMLIPLLALISASLCLVGYSNLTVEEQHQEFGILRAIGTRPRVITLITSTQSLVVLLSGFGFGISLGTMATLMILMANPIVTTITILEISSWLLVSVLIMFTLSLYPAFKLAKTPILKLLT